MTVEDIERSKRFYLDIFGQKIREDYGQNVVFEGGFSIHARAHYADLLKGHAVRHGGNNFELYFEHDDLETLQSGLRSAGVEFVHELRTQSWHQRVLRVYDPDKNIIEIGEPLGQVCIRLAGEGKSVEEIGKMTSLDGEYIMNALRTAANEVKTQS